jgi:hypothetical protein
VAVLERRQSRGQPINNSAKLRLPQLIKTEDKRAPKLTAHIYTTTYWFLRLTFPEVL